jgi:hypothetical protein
VTATGTAVASNTNSTGGTPTSSALGKRKSVVWADFKEIYEEVNGNKI